MLFLYFMSFCLFWLLEGSFVWMCGFYLQQSLSHNFQKDFNNIQATQFLESIASLILWVKNLGRWNGSI